MVSRADVEAPDRPFGTGSGSGTGVPRDVASAPEVTACASAPGAEGFEHLGGGAPLGAGWEAAVTDARCEVRASLDSEGSGAGGSRRYAMLINNGSAGRQTLTLTSAPWDLGGCRAARLRVSAVVFSVEPSEGDRAVLSLRAGDGPFRELRVLAPSPEVVEDAGCRPGMQARGCTRWITHEVAVPAEYLGGRVQLRVTLESYTDRNDAVGVDDVALARE